MLPPEKIGEKYEIRFSLEGVSVVCIRSKKSMENMKFVSEAEPVNVLEEAARDLGIKGFTFPRVGTEAYSRLLLACQNYSREVFLEMTTLHSRDMTLSQSRRRKFHNQLCIMMLGFDHATVRQQDIKNLQRVANLAHMVSGREQYIEEV